jgi:hypothetical protein
MVHSVSDLFGMLYEKLDEQTMPPPNVEKYIELAPTAIDRERIKRRIEALRRTWN